jgi:hypothetical protein
MGRGEGKEPEMVFHISDLLFLFLFPKIPYKMLERKPNP